jgi:branched-chain amino acid transport system substrate-binding protein
MQRRPLLMASALAAMLPTARAQAQPGEIVLGHTGILSGPLGIPVKTMLAGAALAFGEANAAGGVAGHKVRVVSLDDELKPDRAVANYEKLLNEHKAFAFFGCVGSGTTAAAAKVLKESSAPMVGGYAVADSARDKTQGSAYYVRATTGREAEALVQHLSTIGISKIAVAHLDNPGGAEALRLITAALEGRQLKPLVAAGVKGDASNVGAAAGTLAAVQPQAVIMYLGGAVGGELMQALWALNSHPSFYGMSIVPGEVIAQVLGAKTRGLAISQIVPYPWNTVDTLTKEYRRLADAAKLPVGYHSFEGYLNALVMLDALRRMGRDPSRPRLHAALRATKLRLAGMEVDFSAGRHTGSRFVELVQVTHEGRFVR